MSQVDTLSAAQIQRLLIPFGATSLEICEKLSLYLALLLRWNARTNLTSIREPEEMVKRHFGESLFAATFVPTGAKTLLDVGSGAGFPGIPIALSRPEIRVTLAESQGKKAAFLLEVSRQLKLETEVWSRRAETLPVESLFDVVTLRAVDRGHEVLDVARRHVRQGGLLLHLTSSVEGNLPLTAEAYRQIPGSLRRVLVLEQR